MRRNIPFRISSPPRGLWSSFTWISSGHSHMIVLVERSIVFIVDDYSRYTWVYFFKKKSETQQTIIEFANEAQCQNNSKIWLLEVRTVPSSRITPWMNLLVMRGSNINILLLIPLKKMVLRR